MEQNKLAKRDIGKEGQREKWLVSPLYSAFTLSHYKCPQYKTYADVDR